MLTKKTSILVSMRQILRGVSDTPPLSRLSRLQSQDSEACHGCPGTDVRISPVRNTGLEPQDTPHFVGEQKSHDFNHLLVCWGSANGLAWWFWARWVGFNPPEERDWDS